MSRVYVTRPLRRRVHGPCTAMYTTQHTAVYMVVCTAMHMGRVHGRSRAVYTCARLYTAVYRPCTRRVRAVCYTAVNTARTRPCTGHVRGLVHRRRVTAVYTIVYTSCTWPCTWSCKLTRPCTLHTVRVHLRYTAVYTARTHVHGRVQAVFEAVRRPVHVTAVYMAVYGPCTLKTSKQLSNSLIVTGNRNNIEIFIFTARRNARIASAVLPIAIPFVRHTPVLCQNDVT